MTWATHVLQWRLTKRSKAARQSKSPKNKCQDKLNVETCGRIHIQNISYMGIINMKEDKLSKMEIVHIALITAFVLTEIIMSGIMIILMRRTKKIYLEIRNIEKQVEGYIEEVVAAEDDKMYQEKQEKDSTLISSVLKEIFP